MIVAMNHGSETFLKSCVGWLGPCSRKTDSEQCFLELGEGLARQSWRRV